LTEQLLSIADEFLASAPFAYLCSVDEDNQPHVVPVFFVYNKSRRSVFITTSLRSKKISNIRKNPKVSLAVDIRDEENPFNNRGVLIQGTAEIETADKSFKDIFDEFRRKYPVLGAPLSLEKDSSASVVHEFVEVLVRVRLEKMVAWGGGPRFESVKYTT